MKRSTSLIIGGIAVAAGIGIVALVTHFRLLATEGEEHGNETPEQIAQEILTGKPAHSEANETIATNSTTNLRNETHSESEETPEERAAEGH